MPGDERLRSRMSEWQSIETAPKDGTNILICGFGDSGYFVADVKWNEREGEFCLFDPEDDEYTAPTYKPEYWMPLPPPPLTRS